MRGRQDSTTPDHGILTYQADHNACLPAMRYDAVLSERSQVQRIELPSGIRIVDFFSLDSLLLFVLASVAGGGVVWCNQGCLSTASYPPQFGALASFCDQRVSSSQA